MRTRERGIGNMTFIAVLVLLVIAIAMFFVKSSDADKFMSSYNAEKVKVTKLQGVQEAAALAYDAWTELAGLGIPELSRQRDAAAFDVYPEPAVIKDKVSTWFMTQAAEITQRSQAKIKARVYQVDKTTNDVKVQETADTTTITLYGTPLVKETVTVAGFVAPLAGQFGYAAKAIETNNTQFETEYKNYQTQLAALQQRITEAGTQFQSDVAGKAQLYDTEKTRADQMQDQVNQTTAKIDSLSSEISNLKTTFDKDMRKKDLTIQAQNDRYRATKEKMDLALKEDPKDGEVLVADAKQGLAFLNRGKNFRIAPDMKFRIWRVGKGNVRENVAEVQVIDVAETSATARVIKLSNPRVPVAEGMSFSSPFYDPFKKLRVHIAGNLRFYPSDLAKRRLAESGCTVAERLDDTVDVVILGEPAVDLGADAASPEEAAAAEERAKAQRAARVRDTMETAATLGAVVVTEEVLQTFIEY
jgi:hypothetical protein